MDALSSNEQLSPLLEPVGVTESHLGKGSTTARVMDNVLRETKGQVQSRWMLHKINYLKECTANATLDLVENIF